MQYRIRDTPKKGMGQKSLPVGSKDDHIATLFICSIQDFLWGGGHGGRELWIRVQRMEIQFEPLPFYKIPIGVF